VAIRFLNRRFQFSLFALFAVMTGVAIFLGVAPMVRTEWALRSLSNKDVNVDGNYFGLDVKLKSPAGEKLVRYGRGANRALERALADPDKFAAAHVLLTEINLKSIPYSASHWNEMQISLYANGSVDFHKEQIPKLQEFWRRQLAKKQASDN
jgi:hypothetical protein